MRGIRYSLYVTKPYLSPFSQSAHYCVSAGLGLRVYVLYLPAQLLVSKVKSTRQEEESELRQTYPSGHGKLSSSSPRYDGLFFHSFQMCRQTVTLEK